MWDQIVGAVRDALGLGLRAEELGAGNSVARAAVVYVVTLAFVRLGGKRLVGRRSAFDLVLAIVLGSVMSRAISGTAPFFPTLVAGAGLVAVHRAIAILSWHSPRLAALTEGRPETLLAKGEVVPRGLHRTHITKDDLATACREEHLRDVADAERIVLEPNGRFSVLPKKQAAAERDVG